MTPKKGAPTSTSSQSFRFIRVSPGSVFTHGDVGSTTITAPRVRWRYGGCNKAARSAAGAYSNVLVSHEPRHVAHNLPSERRCGPLDGRHFDGRAVRALRR